MREITKVSIQSNQKLNSNQIRTIKNQVLLAPGNWNGRNYSAEEISKAFQNTDWKDKDVISLVADHKDDNNKGRPLTIRDWLGFVSNPRLDPTREGFILGDLNLCDLELATKLIDGKAPFGVSAFVAGKYDKFSKSQKDFIFKNFAVVVEPACKESYINEYLSDDQLNTELEKLSHKERIEMRTLKQKLAETTSKDVQGSKVNSKGLQPVGHKKKKKSNLRELKGGNKMAEEEQKTQDEESTEEPKEEVNEEVKEAEKPAEEVKEEVEEKAEEVKEEPKEVEETEEKLLDKMAEIANKLANKRKLTPEQSKLQSLEKEVSLLKEKVQKLEQEKVSQTKNDLSKEKLSARSRSVGGTKVSEDASFSFTGNGSMRGSRELASMLNLR